MFKKTLLAFSLILFSLSTLAVESTHIHYVLLPNIKTQYLMATDSINAIALEKNIIALVGKTLNLSDVNTYQTARIRIIYGEGTMIKALIVYLLSSQDKSLQLIRINLNPDFTVAEVIQNYRLQPEDLAQSPHRFNKIECPDEKVQFVIGNNFRGYLSVQREVKKIYELAKEKGYNPILMDVNDPKTPQPTVAAYENWLSCPNVKGFYNESHGWEQGIVLSDDDFIHTTVKKDLVNKLNNKVILFDSCTTFQNPLLGAMTNPVKGNAQQYVAGYYPLPFGASERTASCIWTEALNHNELNKQMVNACSDKNDLEKNNFRIKGNGDKYLIRAS